MPELTDPDDDGILEFTQTVEDVDGDYLSITGELDQINGNTQTGGDRDPDWFSFTTSSSLSGGTRVVDVNVEIEASELGEAGTTYTFEFYADDGESTSTCTFTLNVEAQYKFDGRKMYLVLGDDNIYELDLSAQWDVLSASTKQSVSAADNQPVDLFFRPDGKKMYQADLDNDKIYELNLSTPWDISTVSVVQNFNVNGSATAVFFKPDGKKLFQDDNSNEEIVEWELSTAWDLSTVNRVQAVSSYTSSSYGLFFGKEGEKLYTSNQSDIYEFDLSTPWDIQTITFNQSISTQTSRPRDLFFRSDGKKMYKVANGADEIREYDLTTPWDISTAMFKQARSTQVDYPRSVFFGR